MISNLNRFVRIVLESQFTFYKAKSSSASRNTCNCQKYTNLTNWLGFSFPILVSILSSDIDLRVLDSSLVENSLKSALSEAA